MVFKLTRFISIFFALEFVLIKQDIIPQVSRKYLEELDILLNVRQLQIWFLKLFEVDVFKKIYHLDSSENIECFSVGLKVKTTL